MVRFDIRWAVLGAVAVTALAGCSTPTAGESRGRHTSTLGAPIATVIAPASNATTAELGIVQWKIYRSKSDLLMTGYDKKGKAVKGISTGFQKSADGEAWIRTKVNDGSKFKSLRSLSSEQCLATESTMGAASAALVKAAFNDAKTAGASFQQKLAADPAADGAACGADLSAVLAQSLSCMQGSRSKAAQAACIAAAKKATASSATCANTGTTTAETEAAETPAAETAPAEATQDPFGADALAADENTGEASYADAAYEEDVSADEMYAGDEGF